MSALLAPLEPLSRERAGRVTAAGRAQLRQVVTSPMRASRTVFIAVLLGLLGVGMVGVLLLNTTIQQRSIEAAAAQRTADDLGYQQAALTSQVEQLRSSADLTRKAWAMGLRPNPHPVFIELQADGTGRVVGTPTPVTGDEMPSQQYRGADQVTQEILAARAAALQEKKDAVDAARAREAQRVAALEAERAARAKAREAQAAQAKAAQVKAAQAGSSRAGATTSTTTTGSGGR